MVSFVAQKPGRPSRADRFCAEAQEQGCPPAIPAETSGGGLAVLHCLQVQASRLLSSDRCQSTAVGRSMTLKTVGQTAQWLNTVAEPSPGTYRGRCMSERVRPDRVSRSSDRYERRHSRLAGHRREHRLARLFLSSVSKPETEEIRILHFESEADSLSRQSAHVPPAFPRDRALDSTGASKARTMLAKNI